MIKAEGMAKSAGSDLFKRLRVSLYDDGELSMDVCTEMCVIDSAVVAEGGPFPSDGSVLNFAEWVVLIAVVTSSHSAFAVVLLLGHRNLFFFRCRGHLISNGGENI